MFTNIKLNANDILEINYLFIIRMFKGSSETD